MATTSPDAALDLKPAEQAVLAEEITAFAQTLADPANRARYGQLATAAEQGRVPADLVGLLAAMLELILPMQRIRRIHGPEADRALTALFYRTPRGAELRRTTEEVNTALAALRGQALEDVRFTPTPAGQRLTIATGACSLALVIDRAGVRVEHLEVVGG